MAGMGGLGSVRAWALAGASVAAIATPAWGQEAPRPFNIPARDMAAALEAFGRQSETDILFSRPEIRGLTSTPVSGTLRPEDALRRLVGATGLTVRRVNGSTFVIERAPGNRTATDDSATVLDEIVVTGTHIRGANLTAPVHVVSRDDIERSGYGNIADVVRALPENFSGGQNPGIIGASGSNQNMSNAATLNLRGLGTDATLVLVNGHRLVSDTVFGGPDISAIPLAAVRRVEIVTDGSSALYGSDAIAGVANFILRRDYDGVEVGTRLGSFTQGGGFQQNYSVLAGRSGEGWHFLGNIDYLTNEDVTADQRDFTSGATAVTTLSWPQEQTSAYVNASRALWKGGSISVDALYKDRNTGNDSQSTPNGPLISYDVDTSSYSVAAAIEQELAGDWIMSVAGSTARGKTLSALSVGGVERPPTDIDNELYTAEVKANGAALNLPAGSLRVAIGGGYRDETFDLMAASPASGARDIRYAFVEALLPIIGDENGRPGLRELDFSASARVERYSDFGSATTPKLGFRYVPFSDLSVRGTWGESFKAPSLYEQFRQRTAALYPVAVLGGSGPGDVLYVVGGNPDLGPERSESWTLGADWTPTLLPGASFSATYFSIDYTDRVVSPVSTPTLGLSDPRYAPFVQRNPSAADQAAILATTDRFTNVTGRPYDPNSVVAILTNFETNAAAQEIGGLDLAYRHELDFGETRVQVFANATWTRLDQTTLPDTPAERLSGTIENVADFKARGGATFSRGGLAITGIVNHIADFTDTGIVPNRRIGSWTTADASLSYDLSATNRAWSGVQVAVSATNLLDRDPPYAASPGIFYNGINFDSTNSSVLGRFVAISLRKRF